MSAGAARPAHRSDIDGLRAIAVVSVVLAHAGAPWARGGFLGVDVFFVISGFLITRLLAAEIEQGGIRFAHFYERRARRILPALVLVLACSTPFALWLMLPEFLQNHGQGMFATVFFSNNIKLALTADYWDLQSAYKPLLHTWSLGVEEQFYLVFPAFLALAARYGTRGQVLAVALAGAVSFALSEITFRLIGEINFYLPTSRAWELMAGAAAAYIPSRPRAFDQPITLACLVAVIVPMGLFGDAPTPSAWCLPSVLGTAGLLAFGRPQLIAGRVLAVPPLAFVGLISYSAYLWHQPLFAFARIASLTAPSAATMAGLTLLTFVLAALSWKFVEEPFRNPALPFRRLVPWVFTPALVLAALGLVIHFSAGFPRWTYPNIRSQADIDRSYVERVYQLGAGRFPDNGQANILVIGNSFGRDAANVLIESGAVRGKNLRYARELGATPLPETPRSRELLADADVLVVAISGPAGDYIEDAKAILTDASSVPVVVVGDKYFGESINPYSRVPMARRARTYADAGADVAGGNDAVRAALPADGFIDLMRALGPDGRRVRFFDDHGNPLTMDRLHFTRYGARFVGRRLIEQGSPGLALIANARPHAR